MTAKMTLEDLNNIDVNDENQVMVDDGELTVTLSDGREYSANLEDLTVMEDAIEQVNPNKFNELSNIYSDAEDHFPDYDYFELYEQAVHEAFFAQYEDMVRAAIRQQFCK